MNNTEIQSLILEKRLLLDRFGKEYLLLNLEEEQVVFVFPSKVRETEWEKLQEGKLYTFTIEESKNGNKIVVSFQETILIVK